MLLGTVGAAALIPLASACGDNITPQAEGPGVVIIGAGTAGLTAAHFLKQAGVRADVYEASMRVGGRMWTDRESYENGQLVELGGELVDSDHVVMQALCTTLGLQLDDLPEATLGLAQDLFFFTTGMGGAPAVIDEAAIVAAFTPVAAKMEMVATIAEGTDDAAADEYARIDAMSIPEFLQEEAGLAASTLIRRILEVAYTEEYGLEAAEQSAWNLIYLIDYANPDPFRIFGDSDERFHIHEGSDAVPTRLAARLDEEQLHFDHALTKVVQNGDLYELTFAIAGEAQARVVEAAHVIYAIPFTRLRDVDLEASGMSEDKLTVIRELGYGTNAKLMMQFSSKPWETGIRKSNGSVITDVQSGAGANPVELQSVWATSRGQDGVEGILTNFVGGERGVEIGEGTAEEQAMAVLPLIEQAFPGTAATYKAGSAIRMHWPSYPHAKGSYACYRVGQWAYFGTERTREGNQHFCGEHTSENYQGYMEGAAESGAMVAGELLDDLELAYPPVLATLLSSVTERRAERRRTRLRRPPARRAG